MSVVLVMCGILATVLAAHLVHPSPVSSRVRLVLTNSRAARLNRFTIDGIRFMVKEQFQFETRSKSDQRRYWTCRHRIIMISLHLEQTLFFRYSSTSATLILMLICLSIFTSSHLLTVTPKAKVSRVCAMQIYRNARSQWNSQRDEPFRRVGVILKGN